MPVQGRATRSTSQGLNPTIREERRLDDQEGTSDTRLQDPPTPDVQVAVNAAIQQFTPTIASLQDSQTTLIAAIMEMQRSIQALASQQPSAPIRPSGPGLAPDAAQATVSRPPPPRSSTPLAIGLAASSPPIADTPHPVMPSRRPQADLGPVLQQVLPVVTPQHVPARSSSKTHESIEMEPNPYPTEQHQTIDQLVDMSRPPNHTTIHLPLSAPAVYHPSVVPAHQVTPSGGSGARGALASHHPFVGHEEPSSYYVSKSDFDALLHRLSQNSALDSSAQLTGHAPYANDIAITPYPLKYKQPAFALFNGREGNAREHLTRFVGSLEQYGPGDTLKLREFHKSLTGLAYSWYHKIPDGTIHSWSDMVQLFHDKFHYETERVTIVDIVGIRQNPGEDLNAYVTRFHHKCLECTDFSKDETLVPICIKNMKDTYRVYLENLQLRSWGHLKEAARRTYDSVGPSKTPKPQTQFVSAVTIAATSNDDTNRKRQSQRRDERPDKRGQPTPAPEYPCDLKTVSDLLETWIDDNAITLPNVDNEPTPEDLARPNYCPYHRKVGHGLKWCRGLKFVFADKIACGKLKL